MKIPCFLSCNSPFQATRDEAFQALKKTIVEERVNAGDSESDAISAFSYTAKRVMRDVVLDTEQRYDGRDLQALRQLSSKVSLLARPHGSALFSRGNTQSLCALTLGSPDLIHSSCNSTGKSLWRHLVVHYDFPPYSVNEVGRAGGGSRREIGHSMLFYLLSLSNSYIMVAGALVSSALEPVLPNDADFPYSMRLNATTTASGNPLIVSFSVIDIFADGSSSMASVCGGCLALMDAGVPITRPVAGISIGLFSCKESGRHKLVTDIIVGHIVSKPYSDLTCFHAGFGG